eukprot:876585-Pelagomonas_calceolata.AAC.1
MNNAVKKNCIQAVKSGQAVHACRYLKKEYKEQTRRARRAQVKYQKAVFLDRPHRHMPDIHELMRKPKKSHPTPITAEVEVHIFRIILVPTSTAFLTQVEQLLICMAWVAALKAHILRRQSHTQLGLRVGTPLVQQGAIHIFHLNSWVSWVAALKALPALVKGFGPV